MINFKISFRHAGLRTVLNYCKFLLFSLLTKIILRPIPKLKKKIKALSIIGFSSLATKGKLAKVKKYKPAIVSFVIKILFGESVWKAVNKNKKTAVAINEV